MNDPIIIAHRGNLDGPNKEMENNPDYIKEALKSGYEVEVDLWYVDKKLFLGHDEPQYNIDFSFINSNRFWIHCKNIEALEYLSHKVDRTSLYPYPDFFFHDIDEAVLTRNGYIWTYPGKILGKYSICVLPELNDLKLEDIKFCPGICTDYVKKYIKND